MNEGDFDKSIQHSEIGLKILETTDFKQYLFFSTVAKSMAHFGNALENLRKTVHLLTSRSDKFEIVLVLNTIGKIYHQKGDYDEAQKNYTDSLNIAREIDDKVVWTDERNGDGNWDINKASELNFPHPDQEHLLIL